MDTRTVFELRREGKVQEALDMALKLYQIDPDDSWTQSALAWPLIDLCKESLRQNSLNQAQKYFNQFFSISEFHGKIKFLTNQNIYPLDQIP